MVVCCNKNIVGGRIIVVENMVSVKCCFWSGFNEVVLVFMSSYNVGNVSVMFVVVGFVVSKSD